MKIKPNNIISLICLLFLFAVSCKNKSSSNEFKKNKKTPVETSKIIEKDTSIITVDNTGNYKKQTEVYEIDIQLPIPNNKDIKKEIYKAVKKDIDVFIDECNDMEANPPEKDYFKTHTNSFIVSSEKKESDYINTFLIQKTDYFGGAHGNHNLNTFSYSKENNKRLFLKDILSSNKSIEEIAKMANTYFYKKYGENRLGTLGSTNGFFKYWFASNNEITFVFMHYQVAAYSEGKQFFSIKLNDKTKHLFNLNYFNL